MLTMSSKSRAAPAPAPDVHAQKRAALEALQRAEQARDEARSAFVRAGTPESEQGLRDAEAKVGRARLYLERAAELVRQAERAEAEARRGALEAERDRLRRGQTQAALAARREPLAAKEAAALIAFIEVRAARRGLEAELLGEQAELDRTLSLLGEPLPRRSFDPRQMNPQSGPVLERLKAYARALPLGDTRRVVAEGLVDTIARAAL